MRTVKPGDTPQFTQAMNEAQGDEEGIIYCAVYDPIKGTAIYENLDIPKKKKAKQDFLLSVQSNSSPKVPQKGGLSQDIYTDAEFYGVSQVAQW